MKKVPKGERAKRAREALETVRLADYGKQRPTQLSGGQRQRVALARALVNRPKVLLLDEPLGALDLKLRREMQIELKQMQREVGITFVFVTHDQEEALTMSDRIAIFRDGRIEQVGSPDDLYDAPANDFVMGFLGEVTVLDGHLIRPHDVVVHTLPTSAGAGAVRGEVVRVARVGFEVRVAVRPDGTREAHEVVVTLTRTFARSLGLEVGSPVWLEPETGARVVPVRRDVPAGVPVA